MEVKIKLSEKEKEKYSRVIYWAALPSSSLYTGLKEAKDAYGNFDNSGIAIFNSDGIANLTFAYPQRYYTSILGGVPQTHVHYSLVADYGMIDRVNTIKVDENGVASGSRVIVL